MTTAKLRRSHRPGWPLSGGAADDAGQCAGRRYAVADCHEAGGLGRADAKNTRQARASTAFTLSYTGADPVVTQRVVAELVDLYLAENERSAARSGAWNCRISVRGIESTFQPGSRSLRSQLADFKSKNAGMLPEEKDFNAQLLDRTQNQLLEFMRQAQAARERQAFLQAQLARRSSRKRR